MTKNTTAEVVEAQNKITLTPASLDLLIELVNDSSNWSNHPMLDLDDAGKGNFTDLKKKGLVGSYLDEGISWANFKFEAEQIVTDGVRSYSLANLKYYSTATKLS